MIVDRECFLGPVVDYLDPEKRWIARKPGDLPETKLAGEERVVVANRQRVARRHSRNASGETVAAEYEVVGGFETLNQLFPLFGRLVVVKRQLGVVVGVGVPVRDAQREPVVPVFDGYGRAWRDVSEDPLAGLDSRYG